jgi:hypothetical protein
MHNAYTDRLSEYVDDELEPGERLALERHLLDCAACRGVLVDLRRVAAEARLFEDAMPAHDLWPGIAPALSQPAPSGRRLSLSIPQAIAASVLLVVVSSLSVWVYLERGDIEHPGPNALVQTPGAGVPAPVSFTDERYDRAVEDLLKVLADAKGRLNPRTVATIERNLRTIDRAIADARGALERDPVDPFLTSHLADQRRVKLTLLRQARQLAQQGN